VRGEITRNTHCSLPDELLKPCDIKASNAFRFRAERRERILRVRAISQKRPKYLAVRSEMSQLDADQRAETILEILYALKPQTDALLLGYRLPESIVP